MVDFSLKSSAFDDGEVIPRRHGYKNGNISPPLNIDGVPEGTVSLALIMDDPDAIKAVGKVWVHWILWNIDPNTTEIGENSAVPGSIDGKTDFGENRYGGPAPPDREHTYVFKLYALDQKMNLEENSTKKQLEDAMKNHIIAETKLCGRYSP